MACQCPPFASVSQLHRLKHTGLQTFFAAIHSLYRRCVRKTVKQGAPNSRIESSIPKTASTTGHEDIKNRDVGTRAESLLRCGGTEVHGVVSVSIEFGLSGIHGAGFSCPFAPIFVIQGSHGQIFFTTYVEGTHEVHVSRRTQFNFNG